MLGARIAALRRQAGISQLTLAKRLNVSPSTVGMYEQGRRTPNSEGLVTLAEIFGVSTDFLLTGHPAVSCDVEVLQRMFLSSAGKLDGTLQFRHEDGSVTPMGSRELAELFVALLCAP